MIFRKKKIEPVPPIDMEQVLPDKEFPNKDYYPFFYRGRKVEQNRNIFAALDAMAARVKPVRIFELGFRMGGFTSLLNDHPLSDDAEIYIYDKVDAERVPTSDKITKTIEDVWKVESKIGELIQRDGLSIVFCDGGDKNAEVRHFAQYLKEGDIILGHDYAPNIEVWREEYLGKIWDWHECWDGQIDGACRDFNLHNFLEEEFNAAVWCCKRKYNE